MACPLCFGMTIDRVLGRIFIKYRGRWYSLYLEPATQRLQARCYRRPGTEPDPVAPPVTVLCQALTEMLIATGLTPIEYRRRR